MLGDVTWGEYGWLFSNLTFDYGGILKLVIVEHAMKVALAAIKVGE